jgi:hypothetical protein
MVTFLNIFVSEYYMINLGKRERQFATLQEEIKKNHLQLKDKMLKLKEISEKNPDYKPIYLEYKKSYDLIINNRTNALKHINELIKYLDVHLSENIKVGRIRTEKRNLTDLANTIKKELHDLKI